MNKRYGWHTILPPVLFLLASCTSQRPLQQDIINDQFPEAQAELREAVEADRFSCHSSCKNKVSATRPVA